MTLSFDQPVDQVARQLLGAELLIDGIGGVIVETEAYGLDDAASHSFKGETVRNRAMFGPSGHVYVYRSYGLHWCLNIVCRRGEAVLIRALEPKAGIEVMIQRRATADVKMLCSGPGRLAQALGVTDAFNHLPITAAPFSLRQNALHMALSGKRIGITRETDRPWRFGLRGSQFLSRRFS